MVPNKPLEFSSVPDYNTFGALKHAFNIYPVLQRFIFVFAKIR